MAQRRDDSNYFSLAKWILSIPVERKWGLKRLVPFQTGITNEASNKLVFYFFWLASANALTGTESELLLEFFFVAFYFCVLLVFYLGD